MKHIAISIVIILLTLILINSVKAEEDCGINTADILILKEEVVAATLAGSFFWGEFENDLIPNVVLVESTLRIEEAYVTVSRLELDDCAAIYRRLAESLIFMQYIRVNNFVQATSGITKVDYAKTREDSLAAKTLEFGNAFFELLDSLGTIESAPEPTDIGV